VGLLGAMAELGEFEEEEHRAVGLLAASRCDVLLAVGEPCRVLVETAREAGLAEAHWYPDKEAAAHALRALLRPGDVVLVKASRSQQFETILPLLTGSVA
jgi:UDP-N-acetylmuramoyl-tripeptide--D-alanyl-D-alanine ligase